MCQMCKLQRTYEIIYVVASRSYSIGVFHCANYFMCFCAFYLYLQSAALNALRTHAYVLNHLSAKPILNIA